MKVIGVTGGIGSGKTTVSGILSSLGAKVIEADKISREIMKKGHKVFDEVVDFFGEDILDEKGEIIRAKLRDIAFESEEKVKALNDITHKYISIEIKNKIKKCAKEDTVVVDAAIPLENGFLDVSHEIWFVTADIDTRIKRVMKRNNLTYSEVMDIIKMQPDDNYYISISNIIIYNNGSYKELEERVKSIYIKSAYK
ncbi:MAG TPA: dephospho-CoA kinase [Ruminiclostridium sp.]|uniref:Dephospho-CoA kinase n=1 Tax=Acetivibrio saccincola TaxID=1677857 RepID=A0A2S8RCQ6_9FIRM|nr:dephospho-CoA kinase [Acetivibrio saccincola]HAA42704.1 dephospho-CoA kinase [Ruminiclostridium sp.]NLW26491.1 dephospho-CoA kinase [Acetivibrio saccincola]PQQ67582.1 dephospho-CoA kinase [Acetivibrio saccincola]HOA97431.1 dephospho-CoA kinase [Acetivibrio saccincola]HQD28901.1 dephospho-CoA kinase [Acetivibrio saccincola]